MTKATNDSELAVNSACPVNRPSSGRTNDYSSSSNIGSSPWLFLFSSTTSSSSDKVTAESSKCPVNNDCNTSLNILPASVEEDARHAQTPHPSQQISLNTSRQISSIPRGNDSDGAPAHQFALESKNNTNWVYPSEQQMYNAMRKKGWNNIPEDSIPVVLQIHNNINERTWSQIQSWEGTTDSDSLNLVRFQGRPRDTSPKAFLFSSILRWYDPPFDRHDWYVQTAVSGRIQRYVIDFYYLPPEHPNMPPIPYIDARPALDHPYALYLHGRRFLQLAFPGISAYLKSRQSDSGR